MERQLPEIKIAETIFMVDVAFAELRQKEVPLNSISLYDLEDRGTYYELNFDTKIKNISQPFSKPDSIISIQVPPMVVSDPEGMAAKYGITRDALPKEDADCECPEELIIKRERELPKISICGDDYIIDWRLKELRSVERPGISIYLNKLDMSPGGEKYVCFYNTRFKQVVDLPATITALPKDTVFVTIPNALYMDAVAVAREYNVALKTFIDRYPLQKNMEARAYPLSQSGLLSVIAENKKKLEGTKKQQPQKKFIKKKRGRSI